MLARIVSNKEIILANITPEEDALVSKHFTAVQKGVQYIDPDQRVHWDGVYRRYNRQKQQLARPFLGSLRSFCSSYNLPLSVRDERPPWEHKVQNPDTISHDFLPGITLEECQLNAIRVGCRAEVGIFDVPTGGGKTELMAGLCKAIPCPTVILAEQRIVIEQIKARLELRDVVDDVGLFYAGSTPSGQLIIVCSIQSLLIPSKLPTEPKRSNYKTEAGYKRAAKKFEATMKGFRKRKQRAKEAREYLRRSEMLLVDECDLATNQMYKNVFRHWFNGRRRYGFSGSVFDKETPVENLFVQEHLGSVICKISRRELEDIGRIVPIRYYTISIGEDGDPKEGSAYDIAVQDYLIHNQEVHRTFAAICETYPNEGTLILVDRDDLGHILEETIPGSVFIHGKTTKRRRNEVLGAFEERDLKVVIGGKIVRRGLDLRGGCENLVIATGGKMWKTFLQQVGRAVRINSLGFGRVWDLYFLCNRYLYSHSRSRLKAAVDQGFRTRVIFRDGQQIDGESFIASRFRRPRRRANASPNQGALFH